MAGFQLSSLDLDRTRVLLIVLLCDFFGSSVLFEALNFEDKKASLSLHYIPN